MRKANCEFSTAAAGSLTVSKFCGVWYFDARPGLPEDTREVAGALAAAGYSNPAEHRRPGLTAGWAGGSEAPAWPGLWEGPGGSICLWDGRLDNRLDLLAETGLPADSSDSALAFALYRRKGLDGLRDLVGDWCLALWDAGARVVVLARDYAGIRPLYFHRNAQALYWSTSLADLVRWTGAGDLDERYIASFLVHGASPDRTPFAAISPVPCGHAVLAGPGDTVSRPFWSLPFEADIRYRDERQYQERLFELFAESVRVRIAAGPPVCAELSGGLDSSSIVCMADRLRRQISATPPVTTFSLTHEDSRDERYFREVERATGLPSRHYQVRQCPLLTPGEAAITPTWWEPRFRIWSSDMAAMGAGVLLTGQFGDFIMGNVIDDTSQVADSLAHFRFGQAIGDSYAWGRAMQVPLYPSCGAASARPSSPGTRRWNPRASVGTLRASMEDSLAPRLRPLVDSEPPNRTWRHIRPGRRTRFRGVGEIMQSCRLQTPEAFQHLSYAHPFAHRPLVEFLLSIPPRMVFGPNQPRLLMRRAFAGLLPPLILNRQTKGDYGASYRSSLLPLATSLLHQSDALQLVARGYVDRASLLSRLDRFTQGLDCNENQLRLAVLLEYWLRIRAPLVGVNSST